MSQTYYTILTKLGAELLANATALGIPLKLTSMAVGDGNGSVPKPTATQTALTNEVRRAAINSLSVDKDSHNQIIAEQVIPENEGGWFIHEIGLFDDKGNLIAIGNCPPTYKPKLSEGSGRTQVIRMIIIIDNIDSVELKIDPSVVLATREYVDNSIETRVATSRKINNKKLERDIILNADDINALPANKKMSGATPIYEVGNNVDFKHRLTVNNSIVVTIDQFKEIKNPSIGWYALPNGYIHQFGTVKLNPIGEYNIATVAGVKYYTHVYKILLPRAYPTAQVSTTVSLAGAASDAPQSNEYGIWVRSNRGSDGVNAGVSRSSFDVSVTSSALGFTPVIHFSSDGY